MFGLNSISSLKIYDKKNPILSKKIIIFFDKEYYYIEGIDDDLKEIVKMPNYIIDDWIKNNKKEINISFLNKYIYNKNKLFDNLLYGTIQYHKTEKELSELNKIRKDIIKNGKI